MHFRLPIALTLFGLLAPLASAVPAAVEQRNNGGHPTSIIKTTTAGTKTASGPPGPTGTTAVFDLGLFHLLREIVEALPQDVPIIVDPSTVRTGGAAVLFIDESVVRDIASKGCTKTVIAVVKVQ